MLKQQSLGLFGILVACIGLTAFMGCGGEAGLPKESTVPAAGTLTYKGKALEHYQVTFVPLDTERRGGTGVTDASGKFTLGTNSVGDGVVAGKHKVTISFQGPPIPENVDPADMPAPKAPVNLPAKYSDSAKTDLEVEIPAGGNTDIKLEL